MIEKIKTFLIPKITYPFTNHSRSKDSSVQIKNKLNLNVNLIVSDKQLIELLKERLKEISDMDIFRIDFYFRKNKENHTWISFFDQKEWEIVEKNDNNERDSSSLYKSTYYKKSKTDKNNEIIEMILIKISENHHYLLEVFNRKKHALFYLFFITQLENLINSYKQQKQTKNLIIKNKSYESRLTEARHNEEIAQKAMKRKLYELHNLVETSNEIYSILDLKQLINSALLTIIGQVGFQQAFMLIFNKDDQKFNKIYHKGFGNVELEGLEIDVSSSLIPFFLKHRTPIYLSRLEQNNDLRHYTAILKSFGVFIVAPLVFSERLQGIVCAGEKMHFRNFTESDFEIFNILVNIISISIGNAYLFQDMKNLSLTDGMTNLHNYRYFEGRLKEEINRAIRHRDKVSLMMLDIDYFKNYNDTLGHQAGDTVLRSLSDLLKNIVRDEDIVARYGGEEFCIILPGIHKDGISSLGERVRVSVESEPFFKEEVQPGGKLTISLGIATFPDDAKDYTNLVENADKALYRAKNLGRNQIRLFKPLQ